MSEALSKTCGTAFPYLHVHVVTPSINSECPKAINLGEAAWENLIVANPLTLREAPIYGKVTRAWVYLNELPGSKFKASTIHR